MITSPVIELDFDNESTSLPGLRACAIEACSTIEQHDQEISAVDELKIVLTNKLTRANAEPAPGEVVFFISDFRAVQRKVTQPHTVVVREALTYLPRIIVASTLKRFGVEVPDDLEAFVV